jgi:hypothetical protein
MKGSSKMTVCTARNNPGVVEVYRFSRNIICMLIMLYSSQQFHNTFALLAGRVFFPQAHFQMCAGRQGLPATDCVAWRHQSGCLMVPSSKWIQWIQVVGKPSKIDVAVSERF